jgi:ATP-dependent Lhr-like helicase
VGDYRPDLLDRRGHAGEVAWGRLSVPAAAEADEEAARRVARTTPITLCARADLGWLLAATRGAGTPAPAAEGVLAELVAGLRDGGARFLVELATATGRPEWEIEAALWDGVARGVLTADSFWAIRSLLDQRRPSHARREARAGGGLTNSRRRLRRAAPVRPPGEGRWALIGDAPPIEEPDELAEAVAEQLLSRWGVLFRDLAVRERLAVPWREVQWALRRLEARGLIRGGRFVTGFSGEQYALPEAVELLAAVRREPCDGRTVLVNAADPLNLTGVVTPGRRVAAVQTRTITYVDGVPLEEP